jgi:hypothetical protein
MRENTTNLRQGRGVKRQYVVVQVQLTLNNSKSTEGRFFRNDTFGYTPLKAAVVAQSWESIGNPQLREPFFEGMLRRIF